MKNAALGTAIGAGLGAALHNIAVWVAIGAALGVAFGGFLDSRSRMSSSLNCDLPHGKFFMPNR
jgi:hypothetical protein